MDFQKLFQLIRNEPEIGLESLFRESSLSMETIYKQRFILTAVAASKLIPLKIKELESEFVIDLSSSALSIMIKDGDRFNPNRLSVLFSESFSTTLPRELKIDFVRFCDWVFIQSSHFKDAYVSSELLEKRFVRVSIGAKDLESSIVNTILAKELQSELLISMLSNDLNSINLQKQQTKV